MKKVSLEFDYRFEDFRSAVWLYYKFKRDFLVAAAGLGLGAFLWIQFGCSWAWIFLISVSSLAFVVFVACFLVLARRFRQNPKYKNRYFLQFSPQGIHFRTQNIDSRIEWKLYSRVLENEKLYLLIHGKDLFTIIPKRVFDSKEQETHFKGLLKEFIH